MAVTATPIFAQAVRHKAVAISTANTNRDGTGTIGTVFTAERHERLEIDRIVIEATGTTTAGVVRLYVHDGSTAFLEMEVLIGAITPSTTVSTFRREIVPAKPIRLGAGWSLRASTHNAETFNIHGYGYDF
jgi:hypothetical protein